ncbi:MAG: hypothetical protein KF813_03405 [Trueperaceae bacterium]|nr:hypothetical protein [Trueperaceae bacterium]
MSKAAGRPVGWREALKSRAMDPLRYAWLHLPPKQRTVRELAFHRYRFEVRRILRRHPSEFTVLRSRELAVGAESKVVALTLATNRPVQPADLLYLWWRNDPAAVATAPLANLRDWYWTTPLPYRSSHLERSSAAEQAASIFDLGEGPAQPLSRTPRIEPRLYTVASASGKAVELHITTRRDWPKRASSYLANARPGEKLTGWVFPHPHRLPRGPGFAVVTGSGAAAVFAALRSGTSGVRLIWGLGDKRLEPWVSQELAGHEAQGALEKLTIVSSPKRVTDDLSEHREELIHLVRSGGWIYISGNEAMGEAADEVISGALGTDLHRAAYEDLRYIVST